MYNEYGSQIEEEFKTKNNFVKKMKELFEVYSLSYKKEVDGKFIEFMKNSMMEDLLITLGIEDLDEEIDDDLLKKLPEDLTETIEIPKYSCLLSKEEYKAFEKTIDAGIGHLDDHEKDILATRNIPLVHSIVKKFANTGIEYSELLSAGFVGYAKGLDTYLKGKNVKFSTYAYRCIKNEILYFLRREKRHRDNDVSLFKPISTDKNGNVMTVDSTISTEDVGQIGRAHV